MNAPYGWVKSGGKEKLYVFTYYFITERDRAFIKEIKAHRDAEEELMADTEGWEVGTWFGQKVYKTVPENK